VVSWLPGRAPGATPLDRVFGLRPNLYAAWRDFEAVFWERGLLEPGLLELCRLRVAQLLGCESALGLRHGPAGLPAVSERRVEALDDWASSPLFSAAERACLAFAEMFVRDPHAIADADAAAVVEQLGQKGLVALCEWLALCDGFSRFRIALAVEPEGDAARLVDPPATGASSAH
jgi:alkylhydroperoxidase family enzyme